MAKKDETPQEKPELPLTRLYQLRNRVQEEYERTGKKVWKQALDDYNRRIDALLSAPVLPLDTSTES
jgi:hypothetical protein